MSEETQVIYSKLLQPEKTGFLVWLLLLLIHLPYSLFQLTHVQLLLLAAPLWLVPLGWRMLDFPAALRWSGFFAAALLMLSFSLPPSLTAFALALPWFAVCTIAFFSTSLAVGGEHLPLTLLPYFFYQ